MAVLVLHISAAGVLAAPTVAIPTPGVVLVRMKAGFFTPARILAVPAGTRLPCGVHAVVVVAGPAAAGSGRRGATRWAVAAAAAPSESTNDAKLQADNAFYGDLEAKGAKAIEMLNWIGSPAGKAVSIKDAVEKAMRMAKAKEDKFSCIKALLFGIYGVIDLARESAPAKKVVAVDK